MSAPKPPAHEDEQNTRKGASEAELPTKVSALSRPRLVRATGKPQTFIPDQEGIVHIPPGFWADPSNAEIALPKGFSIISSAFIRDPMPPEGVILRREPGEQREFAITLVPVQWTLFGRLRNSWSWLRRRVKNFAWVHLDGARYVD